MSKKSFLFYILFFFLQTLTYSYDSSDDENIGSGKKQLEHFRKLKIVETLDLNEETTLRFFVKLNEFENKIKSLKKQKQNLMDSLEILVEEDAKSLSFEKIFDELIQSEEKLLETKKTFQNEMKSILTSEQMAKYLVFEKKFRQEVKNTIEQRFRKRKK